MLNIGSGDWSNQGWTNLDYPTEYYKGHQSKHKFIPYDIRNDVLPFTDGTVDVIYCSHVIEHIENKYIQKMFYECSRVLKKEGVMRIACPDAEYLYQISKCATDYWEWRKKSTWFFGFCKQKGYEPKDIDFLIAEIATPKSLQTINYLEAFQSLGMYDFFEYMTSDLEYNKEHPGDHINYWTFEKMNKMLKSTNFDYVIRSKWHACCNNEMKAIHKFDTTHPQMSLYVDAIK
jgi:ubiquinone/menaquinone biosynthesis C-methylase UbiE